MPPLLAYCDVLTGDLDAAQLYFDIQMDPGSPVAERFVECARNLKARLPQLGTLAMSFRGQSEASQTVYSGAMYDGQQAFYTDPITLPSVVDRIGSGDAFTAGLIYALSQKFDAERAISFATACGALKHGLQGDYALLTKEEIVDFAHQGPSGRIIR
jgi:2-dehydro-3-deoxygluconokinase